MYMVGSKMSQRDWERMRLWDTKRDWERERERERKSLQKRHTVAYTHNRYRQKYNERTSKQTSKQTNKQTNWKTQEFYHQSIVYDRIKSFSTTLSISKSTLTSYQRCVGGWPHQETASGWEGLESGWNCQLWRLPESERLGGWCCVKAGCGWPHQETASGWDSPVWKCYEARASLF